MSTTLTGHYDDSLNDAKAATELQPSYLKAIIRGKEIYQPLILSLIQLDEVFPGSGLGDLGMSIAEFIFEDEKHLRRNSV